MWFLSAASLWALGGPHYVETSPQPGAFGLVEKGAAAAVQVDASDWPGVLRAAHDLQADVDRVTGVTPVWDTAAPRMVLIGTVGKSLLIDQLVRAGKIDVSGIRGKWESFFLQVVANPLPGVDSALVIAGSDKRGTIYGIYDLSEQIGVSPWYWWADVTPEHKDCALLQAPASIEQGEPSVKYRGIFFNDEKPDLDYWVRAKFGEHRCTPGRHRNRRQLRQRVLCQSLRAPPPPEGQLPVARHVEQRLRRRRSRQRHASRTSTASSWAPAIRNP